MLEGIGAGDGHIIILNTSSIIFSPFPNQLCSIYSIASSKPKVNKIEMHMHSKPTFSIAWPIYYPEPYLILII